MLPKEGSTPSRRRSRISGLFFRRSAMRSRHGLVFEARNGAHVVRASRAHRAVTTGSSIAVIDFGEIAQPAVADRRQHLAGRANIRLSPRVDAELVLTAESLADRGYPLWLRRVGDA